MSRQILLILVALLLVSCDSGKQYPTAPAPKSLNVKPIPAKRPMSAAADDDDADDDDGDDGDSGGRLVNASRGGSPAGMPRPMRVQPAVKTINGHPKGPRAAVFNAVVNNAMRSASACFAKEPAGQTLSFRVKMTVGNAGAVTEAKVVAGPEKPAIRTCLQGVVKALTFPAFEGPPVSQVLPFTAVRQ